MLDMDVTLHELETEGTERRWSLVTTGPIAYLTCEQEVAERIRDALNEKRARDNHYVLTHKKEADAWPPLDHNEQLTGPGVQ
jgi:hypothetical protein